MDDILKGVLRCPHCRIARPNLTVQHRYIVDKGFNHRREPVVEHWAVYQCSACEDYILTATGSINQTGTRYINEWFPSGQILPQDLPERAANYLEQAIETRHAPDGALMLVASAVDAMLKGKGYTKGSLNDRIDKAARDHILTDDMAEWAHKIRLDANNPRHADEEKPHATKEEAGLAIEFALVLGKIMYELPAKITREKQAANKEKGKK